MKSLVEEASSITKAIEKAWTRAGKPQSFSVKIFENPEVGFLGLTTKKSAKVGIFFEEAPVVQAPRTPHNKPAHTQERAQDNRPQREYTPRPDNREQRPERRQDSRERGPRQHSRPNNRPHQDRDREQTRDNRPAHPRHRDQENSHAPRPPRHHAPANTERPERPERYERPQQQQEAPQERVHVAPTPQQQAPVKPLDVTAPVNTAANIKRAPKISGRRFVAPKKDDESNKS